MQKLCCVRTIQQPLPVWIIVTSLPAHISINSHPLPVGIVSVMVIGPICGHERQYVIRFFHGVDMKGDIVKCPCPGVGITHVFVLKMGFDGVTLYIFGPVSLFFYQNTGKYSLLPQLNDPLENTKPAVEDHNETLVLDW